MWALYGRGVFLRSTLVVGLMPLQIPASYIATPWIKSVLVIFFRGKIYDRLKKGILLNWINSLHSRPEALRGASCAKTHFIHILGGSCQANIRSNVTLLQPRVCFLFYFNEIANLERSESCYITIENSVSMTNKCTQVHLIRYTIWLVAMPSI